MNRIPNQIRLGIWGRLNRGVPGRHHEEVHAPGGTRARNCHNLRQVLLIFGCEEHIMAFYNLSRSNDPRNDIVKNRKSKR
jgi:hypothetical protein